MSISRLVLAMGLLAVLGSSRDVDAQTPAPAAVDAIPKVPARPPGVQAPPSLVESANLRASARFEGTVSPGLKVTLDGSASTGGRVWYRWLQTEGPKVMLDGASKPVAKFVVPPGAREFSFVLVVGDATGVDAASLAMEVEDPERALDAENLRADAGDDQSGKVGRRVVLNGIRSEPRGKVHFRWLQVAGPKVTLRSSDGATASFVPASPGSYEFALVVATGEGILSEPAKVAVNVSGLARSGSEPADVMNMAIDELARSAIAGIDGGSRYADDLSKVFDTVADRMDYYRNYTDAASEMTRRLDLVVPRDKDRRAQWVEQFFNPLMFKVAAGMKLEGVDLTNPEAQAKPLTKPQRARLAEQFRYTAAGLRATRTLR